MIRFWLVSFFYKRLGKAAKFWNKKMVFKESSAAWLFVSSRNETHFFTTHYTGKCKNVSKIKYYTIIIFVWG